MAVLFPKKVPAFSRALGESDDIFDFETNLLVEAEVTTSASTSCDLQINALVIAIGSAQCDFLCANIDFPKSTMVKSVNLVVSGRAVVSCSAFAFSRSFVVWMCDTQERDSCYGSGKWVDALLSSFPLDQNSCIYILTDAPTSDFQADSKPQAPFVRVLKTPRTPALCYPNIRQLEPPNIIAGFAAPIMAYCVYRSLSACVFITYYENLRASSAKSEMFSAAYLVLKAIKELQPFVLPESGPSIMIAQNFDQMYV